MDFEVGDLVLILPPEDFGIDRHDRKSYGPSWNSVVESEGSMDFYVGKVGRIIHLSGSLPALGRITRVYVRLHEIYGRKGGWTFNAVHLRKLEDESS